MLETVIKNTDDFIASVPKTQRKKYGQFFTNMTTASFMASLFNFNLSKSDIYLLDAGAGTGILSAAVIDRLKELGYKGKIHLTCYETDEHVLSLLYNNLDLLHTEYGVEYCVIQDNYITSQNFEDSSVFSTQNIVYDYIIGNPPYLKIQKDAIEAKAMPSVCYGAPNLYFLFWAMGIFNLRDGQELVYIVPRSWTSGAYFKKFREYIFKYCVITDIHLFDSRDKVFDGESVLQETVIIKVKKTTVKPEFINITSSKKVSWRLSTPDSTQNAMAYGRTPCLFSCRTGEIKRHLKETDCQLKIWEALFKIPLVGMTAYGDIASLRIKSEVVPV